MKITTTKKTEQRELRVGDSGCRAVSSMGPSLETPSLHGWVEECPLWSELGPSSQDQRENELELNQLWRPWAVVGRQPLIRSVTLPHQGTASPGEGQRAQAAVLASSLAAEAIGRQGQW